MPRFVILFHEMPPSQVRNSHWDVMFEDGDHLLTWALDASPIEAHNANALELPNHRLEYLTQHGPISDGRGTVKRIDAGEFTWHSRTPDDVTIEMRGAAFDAIVSLRRIGDDRWDWTVEPV